MRIGIISDIHCHIQGFRIALERMGEIDDLYCAGDSVFQFRWSNDVVELLRDLNAKVVQGNHEETILSRDGERALAMPGVRDDLVEWMRAQPFVLDTVVDGYKVHMTHGSPFGDWREYHYPQESIWKKAAEFEHDVVIIGHTHFQMAQRFGETLVINPGSAGDPRDARNNFQLSSAVWDTATGEVEFFNFEDPTRKPPG